MSNNHAVNSLSLFKRFQPKFREITWHSYGYVTEESPKVVEGRIFQDESILLVPGRIGLEDPIPSREHWSLNDGKGGRPDHRSMFQIRKGNLAFEFIFDPSLEVSIGNQLERSIMKSLYAGPFKGRRFFMDPELKNGSINCGSIDVKFSIEGDPIYGLSIGGMTARDWTLFISGARERRAIQTAIDLEVAQAEQKKHHEQDPHKYTVRALQEKLEESMACFVG